MTGLTTCFSTVQEAEQLKHQSLFARQRQTFKRSRIGCANFALPRGRWSVLSYTLDVGDLSLIYDIVVLSDFSEQGPNELVAFVHDRDKACKEWICQSLMHSDRCSER